MTTELDDDTDSAAGSRRMDPELRAMAALLRTLDDLPEAARGRVVRWLSARYDDASPSLIAQAK